MPPPTSTGTGSVRAICSITSRWTGDAALCRVKVHQVEAPRPHLNPAPGRLDGVVEITGLAGEIALREPDGLAPPHIDGRNDYESHRSTNSAKDLRIESPFCWLFSG